MTQNVAQNLHACESLMPPTLLTQNIGNTLCTIYIYKHVSMMNISDQHSYNKYIAMCHCSITGDIWFRWSFKMKCCGVTGSMCDSLNLIIAYHHHHRL